MQGIQIRRTYLKLLELCHLVGAMAKPVHVAMPHMDGQETFASIIVIIVAQSPKPGILLVIFPPSTRAILGLLITV